MHISLRVCKHIGIQHACALELMHVYVQLEDSCVKMNLVPSPLYTLCSTPSRYPTALAIHNIHFPIWEININTTGPSLVVVPLTQNHGDSLHQVDYCLLVPDLVGVLRHPLALVAHVYEDARVDDHHDGESEQVEHAPEHKVAATVHGRHGGAVPQVAEAVPAHGGHQAHDNGHHPDAYNEHDHAAVGHLAVQLHGEDGLVALYRDGQQVDHGRREAGVNQPLAHKPLVFGQLDRPGARVEHHVEVGNP